MATVEESGVFPCQYNFTIVPMLMSHLRNEQACWWPQYRDISHPIDTIMIMRNICYLISENTFCYRRQYLADLSLWPTAKLHEKRQIRIRSTDSSLERFMQIAKIKQFNLILKDYSSKKKGRTVQLHAMEALWGRGGIAPTHSWPRH
jgi:hypothetical protein